MAARKAALRYAHGLPETYAILINGPRELGMPIDRILDVWIETTRRARHLQAVLRCQELRLETHIAGRWVQTWRGSRSEFLTARKDLTPEDAAAIAALEPGERHRFTLGEGEPVRANLW